MSTTKTPKSNQPEKFELINDNCLTALLSMKSESIDLIVSDVPYRIISGGLRKNPRANDPTGILQRHISKADQIKSKWYSSEDSGKTIANGKLFSHNEIKFSEYLPDLFRVLKNKTHCYLMTNNTHLNELMNESIKAGFKVQNILIWKKNNATPNKFYMKNCEFILMLRKGPARNINNMGTKTVIEVNNIIGNKTHPTEKPEELIRILIENSSQPGQVVLDPFMGTGSCGVACKTTGRSFIGIEIDENYFKIAKDKVK